jgi:hypothetical protein
MTRTSANRDRTPRRIARRCARAAGGSAAAPAAAEATFPGGAHVAHASGPEVRGAVLGFIALTDAAALFVAAQKSVLPGAGLPWPEKRLDTAYLMYRRRVPAFLCARHRPPQPLAAE